MLRAKERIAQTRSTIKLDLVLFYNRRRLLDNPTSLSTINS